MIAIIKYNQTSVDTLLFQVSTTSELEGFTLWFPQGWIPWEGGPSGPPSCASRKKAMRWRLEFPTSCLRRPACAESGKAFARLPTIRQSGQEIPCERKSAPPQHRLHRIRRPCAAHARHWQRLTCSASQYPPSSRPHRPLCPSRESFPHHRTCSALCRLATTKCAKSKRRNAPRRPGAVRVSHKRPFCHNPAAPSLIAGGRACSSHRQRLAEISCRNFRTTI